MGVANSGLRDFVSSVFGFNIDRPPRTLRMYR